MSTLRAGEKFLRKILLPADGSSSSLMAEETAAIIAKKTDSAVAVLHVIRKRQ